MNKQKIERITCICGQVIAGCVEGCQGELWDEEKRDYLEQGYTADIIPIEEFAFGKCRCSLNKETLLRRGFVETPHMVLGSLLNLDVGRNRHISIGLLGTPNEMVYLNQKGNRTGITDLICIHNFDYDGLLTKQKLDAILSIFNK